MDNRYRSRSYQQDNRDQSRRGGQDEQFSADSDEQYGEAGWRTQENERWQSGPDFDRGYGRNDPFGRDWGSSGRDQRSDTSSLDDYDRSYGGSSYGPQDRQQRRPYGRSGSYGAGEIAQPRNTMGYGTDRYGTGSFGSGSYRSESQEYGRQGGRIPPRRYDPDERGFFDRASDEVMSWFGDDDAARRRQMDHREDHRGKGPAGYTRSTERILEDANERLMHDSSLDASKITVSCQDGEITLDGTVDSRASKRRAEDIVEDISGVKHVQNNLRVQPHDSYYSETSTLGES
jgi:osmotically-inducible protein OsmY